MDVTDPEAIEWLISLTWPEQTKRMSTLNSALALAARTPPTILAGTAQDHLADIVNETPSDQHLLFIFSWSIYQIFGSPGGRERLVDTAVVAAGGAGTKMSPITRILPKEMLPAGGKPILEHLVHELRAAQITDVLFVITSHKPQILAYFGCGAAYGMDFSYRVQDDGAGPGAPILAAETWAAGQPFVHAFGDNLIRAAASRETPLQQLISVTTGCSALTRVFPSDGIPAHETLLGASDTPRTAPNWPPSPSTGASSTRPMPSGCTPVPPAGSSGRSSSRPCTSARPDPTESSTSSTPSGAGSASATSSLRARSGRTTSGSTATTGRPTTMPSPPSADDRRTLPRSQADVHDTDTLPEITQIPLESPFERPGTHITLILPEQRVRRVVLTLPVEKGDGRKYGHGLAEIGPGWSTTRPEPTAGRRTTSSAWSCRPSWPCSAGRPGRRYTCWDSAREASPP
ncbi:DUF2332 family protein [Streptomyces anulatus]|uniref:DUF2332 family protein n=1 Tax=Streptomyces anulatus TaxID=1892 RepID=UPI001C281299|nr:DUF2332 family protein [Streptomyces anulatus]